MSAPLAPDAVMVLADAIRRSNSFDRARSVMPWPKQRIFNALT